MKEELLTIHEILMCPAECKPITEDDKHTTKLLKTIIFNWLDLTREVTGLNNAIHTWKQIHRSQNESEFKHLQEIAAKDKENAALMQDNSDLKQQVIELEMELAEVKRTYPKKWFDEGVDSVKRKNQSGCCCKFSESDEIESACEAHVKWMELEKVKGDSKRIDWLQLQMTPDNDYCEIYLAGLRNFTTGNAEAFQVEGYPDKKFPTVNAPTLREAIDEAIKTMELDRLRDSKT